MGDLWSQPLRDWRKLFGERNESLFHMLIQWPHEWREDGSDDLHCDPYAYFDRLGMPWSTPPASPYPTPIVRSIDGQRLELPIIQESYEVPLQPFQPGYQEGEPLREYVYCGHDPDAVGRFQEMACGLVHCLSVLPANLVRLLPDADRFLPIRHWSGPSLAQFWELLVHRLAWMENPSSPLRARRKTSSAGSAGHGAGRTYYDFDEETLRRLATRRADIIERFDRKFPPQHFCSILPANVFQCSAWAIDLILAIGSAAESETDRPPTLFGTADYVVAPAKQNRLVAHLDNNPPYLTLDGKPVPTFSEVGTHYVAKLIAMEGEPKSFQAFVDENPVFKGAIVTRVLNKVPPIIGRFIERKGSGSSARLKVEDLQDLQ